MFSITVLLFVGYGSADDMHAPTLQHILIQDAHAQSLGPATLYDPEYGPGYGEGGANTFRDIRFTPGDTSVIVSWITPWGISDTHLVVTRDGVEVTDKKVSCQFGCESIGNGLFTNAIRLDNLQNGVKYDAVITAHEYLGDGIYHNLGSVSFSVIPGTPHTPQNIAAVPGDGTFTVTWNSPNDNGYPISEYFIEHAIPNHVGNTVHVSKFTPEFTHNNAINRVPYDVKVSAVNQYGLGPPARIQVMSDTVPAPPSIKVNPQDKHVILTWPKPADNGGLEITQYKITSRIGEVNPFLEFGMVSGDINRFVASGLRNGVSYQFAVHAVNAVGTGIASNIVTAVPGIVPSAPKNLEGTHDGSYLSLRWERPDNAQEANIESYVITIRELKYGSLYNFGTATIEKSHTDQRIWHPYSGTFHITIHAVNEINHGPASQELVIKTQKRLS